MPKNKKKLKISRKTNTRKNQLFYVTLKQTDIRYSKCSLINSKIFKT